jgi:hypothetical protein
MEVEQQIQQLEQQLSECLIARGGLEDDFGRLIVELFTVEITRITRDITSDKYRKDLMGYNNALSDLLAYKKILRKLQVAAHPERERKLREKIGEATDE